MTYLDHHMMGSNRRGRSPSVVLLFDGVSSRYPYIGHLYRTQQHLAKTLTELCKLLRSCSVSDLSGGTETLHETLSTVAQLLCRRFVEGRLLEAGTCISDIQVFQ